jgi:UDP-N-acetylglucosamine 2-epimerase
MERTEVGTRMILSFKRQAIVSAVSKITPPPTATKVFSNLRSKYDDNKNDIIDYLRNKLKDKK